MTPFHTQTTAKKLEQVEGRKAAESAAPPYLTWEDTGGRTNMIAGPGINWFRESENEQAPGIPTAEELEEMEAAGLKSVLDLRGAGR